MCPECEGLGFVQTVDVKTLIDRTKSLNEGAIQFPTFQPGGWRLTRYTQSGYFDNDKSWKILLPKNGKYYYLQPNISQNIRIKVGEKP